MVMGSESNTTSSSKSKYLLALDRASNRPASRTARIIIDILEAAVLVLSVLLIVYISYDTFENVPFLLDYRYMSFQFWVCIAFLLDFFVELILVPDKKAYLRSHWFFFIISIPYLNIINLTGMPLSEHVLNFLRFIPLVRGSYALSLVVGYVSRNRALSLLAQYTVILITLVYILSLMFYFEEHLINPNVKTFWDALYFAAMNVTTVGCYFSAVTTVGKIISVILPTAGMLMLPLFTVVIINSVKNFDRKIGIPTDDDTDGSQS